MKIWGPKALSGTLFSKRDFLGTFVRKCESKFVAAISGYEQKTNLNTDRYMLITIIAQRNKWH